MSASLGRGISLGRSLYWRCYQDYVMPSRLPEYARLLKHAVDAGYRIVSVEQWAQMLMSTPAALTGAKLLVNRHDIDTDARLPLEWSRIEQEHGAQASYFYRQNTMDAAIIESVMQRGFHVSYHFEELADVAKERGLKSAAEVQAHMPEIQQRFARNWADLRKRFGWTTGIVCSHGDWMNRRLNFRNLELLRDPAFRRDVGISHETYDPVLMDPMQGYYTDAQPPVSWRKSGSPFDAIAAGKTPIGVLTHPRQWQPNFRDNTAETVRRITEGLAYRRHA